MAATAPSSFPAHAWIAPAIGLAGIATLAGAADLGTIAYAAPLLVATAIAVGYGLLQAARGNSFAICGVLVFVAFVLNLSLRTRDAGEVGLDWQNGLKLGAWVMLVALSMARWRRILPLLRRPILILAVGYAAFALLSAAWSEVPTYTAANAIGLLAYLGLGCVLVADVGEDKTLRVLVWALFAYAGAGLVGGLVAPELAWLAPGADETTTIYRLKGFSSHPNVFAQELAVFIVLTLIAHRNRVVGPRTFWVMFLVGTVALLLTVSRTTFMAVLAASVLVELRRSRWFGPAAFAGAAAVSFALVWIGIFGLPNLDAVFGGLSRTGQASEVLTLTLRTDIWEVAWEKIRQRPLLGWGYNGTEALLLSEFGKSFAGSAVNAHNMILQTLVGVGILGSLPVFAFLGLLGRFVTQPDPTRDQILLMTIIMGIGEVAISGVPGLLTLTVAWMLAREAAKDLPVVAPVPRARSEAALGPAPAVTQPGVS